MSSSVELRMALQTRLWQIRDKGGYWTIEGLGLIAVVAAVGMLIAHPEPLELWALDFAVAVGFPGLLILMGYRIGTDELPPEDQWTIAYGAIGGFVLTGVLGVMVSSTQQFEGGIIFDTGYVLVTLATFGAFLGMMASTMSIRHQRVSPLEIFGLTRSEEHRITMEIDSDISNEHVADWFSETVVDDDDLLRLRVLQYLREQETRVSYDAIVSELQADTTLPGNSEPERLKMELHHTHLPKLAAAGLISYYPTVQIARAKET